MEGFCREKRVGGLSQKTLRLYRFLLRSLDTFLSKPFIEAEKEDLIRFVEAMMDKYEPSTVHHHKSQLKAFYAWLHRCDPREYPPCVKWMRVRNPKSEGQRLPLNPEDILTEKDVLALIEACEHPRDQALTATTYETAGRADEVLSMKVKSVMFGSTISHVTLKGKTGERVLPIRDAAAYIIAWLNVHPRRGDLEAPLWWSRQGGGQNISYHNFRRLLLEAKEKAGIAKDVRPHLLRHARLTELAKVLPEQKLKKWAGWTQGSNMASIYVHLSGKDLDEDFKRLHGLPTEKVGPALKGELSPKECPRCKASNPATHVYCYACGFRMDKGIYATDIQERELFLNTYHEVLMELREKKGAMTDDFYKIMDMVEERIKTKRGHEKT